MRLQILITQFNEDDKLIKPLLNSIELQQNIDFKDVEVLIGNDGSETFISDELLKSYSYSIKYYKFEHSRLAGCRKNLFDISSADYIMYCDADDMFLSNIAINLILDATKDDPECIVCNFAGEIPVDKDKYIYRLYENDAVFVHGKVYRRNFLTKHHIEWHSELHEHQDSAFNVLARSIAKKTKFIKISLYLWKYNPESISRKNGKMYTVYTWPHMIDSYDCLVNDLKERGFGFQARYYAMYCIYATYYEMRRKMWHQEGVGQYIAAAHERLIKFFNKYSLLLQYVDDEKTLNKIDETNKQIVKSKDELVEAEPIEDWLKSLLSVYSYKVS